MCGVEILVVFIGGLRRELVARTWLWRKKKWTTDQSWTRVARGQVDCSPRATFEPNNFLFDLRNKIDQDKDTNKFRKNKRVRGSACQSTGKKKIKK